MVFAYRKRGTSGLQRAYYREPNIAIGIGIIHRNTECVFGGSMVPRAPFAFPFPNAAETHRP